MTARYQVRSLGLGSILKFGCLLGSLFSVVPAALCSFGTLSLAAALRRLLESWEEGGISILGQRIPIDLLDLLRLEPALRVLQRIDDLSVPTLVMLIGVGSLLGGTLVALVFWILGLAYNVLAALTGGLSLELHESPPERTSTR
jgi:hypothetical protein